MTVSTTNLLAPFTSTGSAGPYPFTFPISDSTALEVIQNGIVLASSAYTVTPVNNDYTNGGSVTLNTACPAGQTLVLQRVTPILQESSFTEQMPTLYKTFEGGLDKLTEICQELADITLNPTSYVAKVLYGAYTILAATAGSTPVALTVTEQTLVGRITGGVIAALSVAQIKTMLAYGTMASETATDYVTKALYDAYTILMATADNTPTAITIAEQQVIGRITSGAIKGLSVAELQTLINVNPSDYVAKTLYDAYTILMATADNTPVAITIAEQQVVGRITSGAIKGLSIAELQTLLGLATMAYETATNYVTKALFDADSILAATTDNTPAALVLSAQTLVGMITGGHPAALTVAQVKTMLGLATMAYETATNYVTKALYDANTILYATTDNTPVALTVGEKTVVGRITSGAIAALTVAQLQTLALSLALPENVSLLFSASLSADGKYTSLNATAGTLGETVAFGETVYLKASDSKWWKTNATATATSGAVTVGFCCVAGNANGATIIMFKGVIRADALFDTFVVSAPVFLSAATAGKVVSAAPTGTTGFVVRVMGRALDGNTIRVDVSGDYLEFV
jgi:hypothetical protein